MEMSLGHQLFVQLLMRHARDKIDVPAMMQTVAEHYPHFEANPMIGHTILWVLAQSSDDRMDLLAWFAFCLPAFGDSALSSAASFQKLSLDYIDILFEKYTLLFCVC